MFLNPESTQRRAHLSHICSFVILVLILTLAACGNDDEGGGTGSSEVPGELRGLVLDANAGFGVLGATILIEDVGTKMALSKEPIAAVSTSRDGRFTVKDLSAGTYNMVVDGRGVGPNGGSFPIQHYTRTTRRVTITAGETRFLSDPIFLPSYSDGEAVAYDGSQPVSLDAAGFTIDLPAGQVTYPDLLSPRAMALVPVPVEAAPAPLPQSFLPDQMISLEPAGARFDGADLQIFDAYGLEEGSTVDVLGYDESSGIFATLGAATRNAQGFFESDSPFLTTATHLTLACPSHSVTGTVVDALQNPRSGVQVALYQPYGTIGVLPMPGFTATTGSDGSFTISGIRACRYELRAILVSATGTAEQIVSDVRVDPSGITDVGTIEISEVSENVRFDITGTVTDVDGTPQGGMSVFWSIFPPEAASRLQAWHRLNPLLRDFLDAPEPLRQGGFQSIVGADGTFRTPSITASPDYILEVTGDGPVYFTDVAKLMTPALEDNGRTIEVELTACLHAFNCPTGTWSLAGTTLEVIAAEAPCREDQGTQETITVLALNDGLLSLRIETTSGTQFIEFERVQGSGPSSVSTQNLVGLYREAPSNDPPNGAADGRFLGLRSDGKLVQIAGPDSQAGTYSVGNGRLALEPTFATGRPSPTIYDVATFGDRMTLVNISDGATSVLTRCLGNGASSLDGLWINETFSSQIAAAAFVGGEYALASSFVRN